MAELTFGPGSCRTPKPEPYSEPPQSSTEGHWSVFRHLGGQGAPAPPHSQPGLGLPTPTGLSSPQPPWTVLWTPGRGRPVCPLICRKPGGAFVASQLSHCKRFANPKSGRRDAEQGQLSQIGSPVESTVHTSWAPVARSALEDVSALRGILQA